MLASVGVCLFASIFVNDTLDCMIDMRHDAMTRVENVDNAEAEAIVVNMLSLINERSKVLEMLIQHDDLHDMVMQLTDAKVSLSINDMDDFEKALSLFYENLEHIRAHEKVSLSNIL